MYLKYTLLLLLLIACQNSQPEVSEHAKQFRSLIQQADDEKQRLPIRLAAALNAHKLALKQQNEAAQIESTRMSGMLYWQMDSTDKAMASFRTLVRLAEKNKDKESLGIALNNIGLVLSEQSVYDSAIVYYNQAGKLFLAIKDSLRVIQCDINAGIAYKNMGAYEKAFGVTMEAARIMETMNGTTDLAAAYTTLGNTLKELRRPKEALDYHQRALGIRRQFLDSAGVAGSLNNIGNVYKNSRQFTAALKYYLQSLELKRKLGSKSKVTTIDNIAETYLELKQYKLAEQYETEAIALRNETADKDGWMTSMNRLAKIYIAYNQIDKAKVLALRISKAANVPIYLRHQLNNALLLEEIYSREKDYPNAILYARMAFKLKDSLFSSDMSAAIATMTVRFRTEEKQRKLELAEKNDIIHVQQINKQQYFIFLMASIILLLLIITYLLNLSNKLKKIARERTELFMYELNHRIKNNLQIISDILNLQSSITDDPKTTTVIETVRSRIQSIGIVHNLLYQKHYTGSIDMSLFVSKMTQNLSHVFQRNGINIETDHSIENISLAPDHAVPLGLIINELLTNIYKYTQIATDKLTVNIHMTLNKQRCSLFISDNGMPWDRNDALRHTSGLGLLLVDMLVQQLKASWQFDRKEQENVFSVSFNSV